LTRVWIDFNQSRRDLEREPGERRLKKLGPKQVAGNAALLKIATIAIAIAALAAPLAKPTWAAQSEKDWAAIAPCPI